MKKATLAKSGLLRRNKNKVMTDLFMCMMPLGYGPWNYFYK